MLQRSISGPNEADSLNLGDDRSQDEESPASFERVPATFDQESVVTFTTEKEAIDEEAEENQNASEDEAGPSVPRVARGPYRHRKLSARDCYDLAELNLPPLNQVFEVGCKKPMAEKLEYILSTLGRPAMKGEIIDALDTAWPVKKIDKSSSVSALVLPKFPAARLIIAYRIRFRSIYPIAQSSLRMSHRT